MKKIQSVLRGLTFFGLCALALSGCANPLLEKPGESGGGGNGSGGIPEGYGVIGVSFSRGAARTVMPPVELDQLYLKYFFTKDGGPPEEETPADGKFILEPGSYRLAVEAYADGGYTSLAAQGETEEAFVITAGTDAGTVDLTLRPMISGGDGDLEFSLSYPAGAAVETLTLTRIADDYTINLKTYGEEEPGGGPLTLSFSGTKSDISAGYYLLRVTLKKGGGYAGKTEVVHIYQNMTTRAEAGYSFSDEDFNAYLVISAGNSGPGTLRQAITELNALEGPTPVIQVMLEPGSVIELESGLDIGKSIIIEGNGVTLTPAASWTTIDFDSQLLRITNPNAEVTISRVHFKDGQARDYGGAINNDGTLTLESCIFSGNRTMDSAADGGAVYSYGPLTIRGCTFYGNTSRYGGAVSFNADGKTLILTGNLFYGSTAGELPVVDAYNGTISASYNVVDVAFGTGYTQCGWEPGTGDAYVAALPVSGRTFKLLSGSGAAARLPSTLPADYPVTDFYGNPVSGGGAAGAVQTTANGSGYYLELSMNNPAAGILGVNSVPDEDGLYAGGSVTITASPNAGYSLEYWLVNGVKTDSTALNTLDQNLSAHTRIRAVFNRVVTVSSANDSGSGTLREALSNAQDGDVITFSGVTPGTTVIELESSLPEITTSVTIAGNGVTLTPAASWTTVDYYTQLLRITNSIAEVTISRVHFKDGQATDYGGAINNDGTLTLESCIFSGNRTTDSQADGGAVSSYGPLTIRGCTFYGNTSGYYGGAVYFAAYGKTLTLTGNLFYGNTAATAYPVVFNYYNGTVSASYNVADVAFGTGYTQCGWEPGTGDTTLAGLSVTGDPFDTTAFVPVSGLHNILPVSPPADFPATDFYGNPRTSRAPGAVDHAQ